MEAEIDPHESFRRTEALAKSLVAGEPLATANGMFSTKRGMLGGYSGSGPSAIALAPPELFIQPFDGDTLARIGPAVTISRDDIANASFEKIASPSRRDVDPLAISAKLKLRDGRRVKLDVVSGGLYGADGPADLRAQAIASCDAIIAWLKNPS